MDDGNSLLIAVDSQVANEQRQLIADLGVDLEPAGHVVIDHFNHATADSDHTVVTAHTYVQSNGVWGDSQPRVRSLHLPSRSLALLSASKGVCVWTE